jgi:hypothetical protein
MNKLSTTFSTILQYNSQQESRLRKLDFIHIHATESNALRWYSLFLMLDIPVLTTILAMLYIMTKYESGGGAPPGAWPPWFVICKLASWFRSYYTCMKTLILKSCLHQNTGIQNITKENKTLKKDLVFLVLKSASNCSVFWLLNWLTSPTKYFKVILILEIL